ncbi:MAG: bifunctional diguanylate cyclase/phosphodiesterase [Candidatus Aquicultorales bacterium]
MPEFIKGQIDYVFFMYGLAFAVIALVSFVMAKQERRLPWIWLGLFSLSSTFAEWSGLLAYGWLRTTALETARIAFLTLSLFFLFEAGRRLLNRTTALRLGWCCHAPLAAYSFYSVAMNGLRGLETASHLSGLVAGTMTAAAIFLAGRFATDRYEKTGLMLGSLTVGLYGLVVALVPRMLLMSPHGLDESTVVQAIGFFVQLILCVFSIALAGAIWVYSQRSGEAGAFSSKNPAMKPAVWGVYLMIAILAVGWFLTDGVGKHEEAETSHNLLNRARTTAAAVDGRKVAELTGSPADLENPAFQRLREQLSEVRQANPDVRFVYLMGLRGKDVVFLADAEPTHSKDYSPPGQVYQDASRQLRELFEKGTSFVEGPIRDDWGVWVSGLSTIDDPATGRPLAVLGIDIDAADWMQSVAFYRLLGITATLTVVLLTILFLAIWQRTRQASARIAALEITALKYETEKRVHDIASAFGQEVSMLISERKAAEEKIKRMAYYDPLTDLPNRMLFHDRLSVAVAQAHRSGDKLAIMVLDLDRFKNINDTLGHLAGDELLRLVASRLRNVVREGDTVARLGGDEFTLLLPDIQRAGDAVKIAKKVLDALDPSFAYGEHELHISTSIGIALFPNDGEDADTLLKNSDIAMYRAKEKGKNNYQLYAPAMNTMAFERLALENCLRNALEKDEFVIHYQPQIELETGRISGAEALLRWRHPEFGLVLPGEFIPLAEDSGLIIPIGDWVLSQACRSAVAWNSRISRPVKVAVNLSACQLEKADLAQRIGRIMAEAGYDPSLLELEITETVAMRNVESKIKTIRELREMGVSIAIDDFGTGYSSLTYLKRFPINTLKIAHSFVYDACADEDSAVIAKTIIELARNLGLKVIAEGVETAEQLAFLETNGCQEVQGFLLGKPMPVEQFERLLDRQEGQGRKPNVVKLRA